MWWGIDSPCLPASTLVGAGVWWPTHDSGYQTGLLPGVALFSVPPVCKWHWVKGKGWELVVLFHWQPVHGTGCSVAQTQLASWCSSNNISNTVSLVILFVYTHTTHTHMHIHNKEQLLNFCHFGLKSYNVRGVFSCCFCCCLFPFYVHLFRFFSLYNFLKDPTEITLA